MKVENISHIDGAQRISIELGSSIELMIEGVEFSLRSVLIGMEPDKYLIIRAPVDDLNMNESTPWESRQIMVRYIYRDTVLGFRSKVIQALPSPLEALFIEYPEKIERYDRRSEERMPCFLRANMQIEEERQHTIIDDINHGGCRCLIKGSEELPSVRLDEQVTLKWRFPGIDEEQVASGKVKNLSRHRRELTLGIQFDNIAPATKDAITEYISSRSVQYFWGLWAGPIEEEGGNATGASTTIPVPDS